MYDFLVVLCLPCTDGVVFGDGNIEKSRLWSYRLAGGSGTFCLLVFVIASRAVRVASVSVDVLLRALDVASLFPDVDVTLGGCGFAAFLSVNVT